MINSDPTHVRMYVLCMYSSATKSTYISGLGLTLVGAFYKSESIDEVKGC